jgi:hypothetical protein
VSSLSAGQWRSVQSYHLRFDRTAFTIVIIQLARYFAGRNSGAGIPVFRSFYFPFVRHILAVQAIKPYRKTAKILNVIRKVMPSS